MTARPRWSALTLTLALVGACPCPDGSTAAGRAYSGVRNAAGGDGPAPAAAGEDNDRIALINGPTQSVVSLNGKGRTLCYFGKLIPGAGTIDLQDRMESPSTCASSVAAFASDRAAQLAVAPPWTHDPAHPLELHMQPTVVVPIHFYMPQGWDPQDASDEMDTATGLYAINRVGVRFVPAGVTFYTGPAVASSCSGVGALVTAGMYDPLTINVYYVQQVNGADTFLGYNCFAFPLTVQGIAATGENIIFLASHRLSTTLAHELGHALGLRLLVGHTSTAGGFTNKNLMMGAVTWVEQAAQNHFSLGQAYRMSFDRSSWINHPSPTKTVSIRTGVTRACQATQAGVMGDECPPLVLDP